MTTISFGTALLFILPSLLAGGLLGYRIGLSFITIKPLPTDRATNTDEVEDGTSTKVKRIIRLLKEKDEAIQSSRASRDRMRGALVRWRRLAREVMKHSYGSNNTNPKPVLDFLANEEQVQAFISNGCCDGDDVQALREYFAATWPKAYGDLTLQETEALLYRILNEVTFVKDGNAQRVKDLKLIRWNGSPVIRGVELEVEVIRK